MKIFNGNRLKSARLYRGITVEELASMVDVSKQTISQYENGKITPLFEKVLLLSMKLDFPYEYFMQPDCFDIKSGSTYFRALLKTSKKYRVEQTVKMEHLSAIYSFLNEYVNFPDLKLPSKVDYNSPEEAAYELREFWGLGQDPISDIISIVEENGIIVTMFNTSTDDIDAFSSLKTIDNNEEIYLIALSKNKNTASRIHFDVAHELGHIILHEWSEDVESLSREQFRNKEKEANDFAAAFLLPKEAFINDVSSYIKNDLSYYGTLKKKWKVSIAAMICRSYALGLITPSQYQYMFKVMQKKDWRKFEPLDDVLTTESPSLLRDSVDLLLNSDDFNASKFLNELSKKGLAMKSRDIEMLLDLPSGTLEPKPSFNENKIVSLRADKQLAQ